MLSAAYRVRLAAAWSEGSEDLMIALHARRSAASIQAWRERRGGAPLVVVLTGTDLYRDIEIDARAQRSLELADALVVLNAHGAGRLPAALRARAHVVLQSCPARQAVPKPARHLRALMVGHLRDEKDPGTYLRAAERLRERTDLFFDHVGGALDPALREKATRLAERHPRYRWLGPLPHTQVRRRIQAAHLLVHASRMEGGANVIVEALRSGTAVIASRIDGNLGLLGDDWPATFEVGDDAALATLIERARDEPAMLADLQRRAAERAPLFSPEAEHAALMRVVGRLIEARPERRDLP